MRGSESCGGDGPSLNIEFEKKDDYDDSEDTDIPRLTLLHNGIDSCNGKKAHAIALDDDDECEGDAQLDFESSSDDEREEGLKSVDVTAIHLRSYCYSEYLHY